MALKIAFLMLFHPIDAYDEIKRRGRTLSLWAPTVILLLVLVVRYFYVAFVHAPLADIKLENTNLFLEIARFLLPVLTFVVSTYAVISVLSGATDLRTIFVTTVYALVPYIVMTPFSLGISHFLALGEASIYSFFSTVKWVWIILLIFVSIMHQNDYSLKKTIGVSLLSLVGVAIIWAVAVLIISLSVQVVTWIKEVMKEATLFT